MGVLVAVAAAWLVLGAVTAVLMVRRGHDVTTWLLLGILLGPVSPILAIRAVDAERDADAGADVAVPARADDGGVDLLAGIDGSPEAVAALRRAVALHADHLGRVVLAVVAPYDVAVAPELTDAVAAAAGEVADARPTTVELHGDPVTALERFAVEHRFDLLVVGARGRGRSASPLGSVATRLAAGAPVPVLVGPVTSGSR